MIEAEGLLRRAKPFMRKHRELGREAGLTEDNYRSAHQIFQRTSPVEAPEVLEAFGVQLRKYVFF